MVWATFSGMANPTAKFETTMGGFEAEIFVDEMPITGGNFVRLINDGFYNGLHFHRVIANFMNVRNSVQCI